MSIKVVVDSCCDFNSQLKKDLDIELVPLTIQVDDNNYIDNETIDLKELLNKMKASPNSPKTACPSPHDFLESYKGEEESVFIVTLSAALSGTYNSAVLAKDMFLEDVGKKFIHVFDSLSASVGETLISMKILEYAKKNYEDKEIVEKVNAYIKEMKTFFVLESLDNLIKAGRINKLKGTIASLLSIKPIMRGNEDGSIGLEENIRGSKKAIRRLLDIIEEQGEKLEEKILGIAHCNCLERAQSFKEEVLKRYNFKDIIIVETGGISTVYANDGGIIIAF